jgi:hypothetical protein
MERVLSIRLQGEMSEAKLDELRRRLGLQRLGRLSDREDAEFGYRYLRENDGNTVTLGLWRRGDSDWVVHLSYENEPPPQSTVEEYRSKILEAAAALGLSGAEA